jgi:hypothetical protein
MPIENHFVSFQEFLKFLKAGSMGILRATTKRDEVVQGRYPTKSNNLYFLSFLFDRNAVREKRHQLVHISVARIRN